MKNTIHEDKNFNNQIKSHHTKLVSNLSLPSWLYTTPCPFCNEKLTPYSIRGINFKTNPRNFGDLCVDFMCEKCKCGDNIYIRKAFSNLEDISKILNENIVPDISKSYIEEDMYKLQYNNSLENMIGEIGEKNGNS